MRSVIAMLSHLKRKKNAEFSFNFRKYKYSDIFFRCEIWDAVKTKCPRLLKVCFLDAREHLFNQPFPHSFPP